MITCHRCQTANRNKARFCARCGASLRLTPGTVLAGVYRVLAVLSEGGMGAVYQAESDGQRYAVKEMLDHFDTPQDRQDAINRFMAEALMLARLNHPHIPRVHHHFIENGRYYLVMDFVEGADLGTLMAWQGGLGFPSHRVLDWAVQICEVLEYLHGQKPPVLFRDLKPSNIMLRPDGQIEVIDFGIAKVFNPARRGTLVGTPGYAAPEQYQGLAEPRSDIFGLGATLHHLLTGRDPTQHPPFFFPPLQTLDAALDPDLDTILQRAVRLNLPDRWSTVAEVRQALVGLSAPVVLSPGITLAGRYRVNHVEPLRPSWPETLHADCTDLQSGAPCQVVELGFDAEDDQTVRHLASLHHTALPPMEIVTHRGHQYFVAQTPVGTPLDEVKVPTAPLVASLGLQMCDFLEATGARGAGFAWLYLQPAHVLVDSQGQAHIDVVSYVVTQRRERRMRKGYDDRSMSPVLTIAFYLGWSSTPPRDEWEAAEVEIVGNTMAAVLNQPVPPLTTWEGVLNLRRALADLPPSLEQTILGARMQSFAGGDKRFYHSLSELRRDLHGQGTAPARLAVVPPRAQFGKVAWGGTGTLSLRLAASGPGLLYGEIGCKHSARHSIWCEQTKLQIQPRSFNEVTPAQVDITLTWHTSELETCGVVEDELVITTGAERVTVPARIEVTPNAAFYERQARRCLKQSQWRQAIQHCNDWLRLKPESAIGYGLRGNAVLSLQDYKAAVRDYSAAIQRQPEEPVYYWNRSLAYAALQRKREAVADLETYLSLGGSDVAQARQKIVELSS